MSNHRAATVDLGPVEVIVARDAGPRILGYRRHRGPQLFASLGDLTLEHPAIGEYRLLGGHRLWRAPEQPSVTYLPDHDVSIAIDTGNGQVSVAGEADRIGLTKTIRLTQRGAYTIVEHLLHNEGDQPISCAPWAITQLTPGGRAFLPHSLDDADPDGVLPSRHIVLWPYTDLSRPDIEFQREAVVVRGSTEFSKNKLGQPNRRGWIAYCLGDELFVKWAPLHDDAQTYVDHGATVQCYRDERFVELESLGPLAILEPGETISHREIWSLIAAEGNPAWDILAALPVRPDINLTRNA